MKYDSQRRYSKNFFDKTYQKIKIIPVYIKYVARPNEVKQKVLLPLMMQKDFYFINAQGKDADKPTQIWTQGETESSSCWFLQ